MTQRRQLGRTRLRSDRLRMPIGSDADEGIGRERRARGAFGCVSSTRPEADQEPSAQRRARTQELST